MASKLLLLMVSQQPPMIFKAKLIPLRAIRLEESQSQEHTLKKVNIELGSVATNIQYTHVVKCFFIN